MELHVAVQPTTAHRQWHTLDQKVKLNYSQYLHCGSHYVNFATEGVWTGMACGHGKGAACCFHPLLQMQVVSAVCCRYRSFLLQSLGFPD